MCKYDAAFTEKEMLEKTGFCKDCKLDCPNAGKQQIMEYTDNDTGCYANQDVLLPCC